MKIAAVVGNHTGAFLQPVLADEQGNAMVWKLDPNTMTVSSVPVQLGAPAGDQIRVLSGLQAGDRIATSGVHNLREGMQVSELRL